MIIIKVNNGTNSYDDLSFVKMQSGILIWRVTLQLAMKIYGPIYISHPEFTEY